MNNGTNKTDSTENTISNDNDFDLEAIMKKARHKAELPLIIIAAIINLICVLAMALYFKLLQDGVTVITDATSMLLTLSESEIELLSGVESYFIIFFFVLVFIKILVGIKKLYHSGYANGVRVSSSQFPQVYEIEKTLGTKMNFKKAPKVFINSDSSETKVMGVTIHSKTFFNLSPGTAIYTPTLSQFLIAREFAHVYYGHRSMAFYLSTFISHSVPIFGKMLNRCMEYSADRAAQYILGDDVALDCLVKSCVHYLTVRELNVEEYLKAMTNPCKKEASLYYLLTNLNSAMPINRYRIRAMLDPKKKSGKLL